MDICYIDGFTRELGKPKDWDDNKGVACQTLPILDTELAGQSAMVSQWKPTQEEIARIAAGAPVYLWVYGTGHPPVMLTVDSGEEWVDEVIGPVAKLEADAKANPLDLPGEKPGLFEEHMDQMGFVCLNTEGDASVYACTPKIAYEFHQHARTLEHEQSEIHELKGLVRDFFGILDIVEVSAEGKEFHPTTIGSCRAVDGHRLNKILLRIKELAQ